MEGKFKDLETLLGFDPSRSGSPTAELFREVLEESKKERREQAKAKTKQVVNQAIEIYKKAKELDAAHTKAMAKLEKELAGLNGSIKRMVEGAEQVLPEVESEIEKV